MAIRFNGDVLKLGADVLTAEANSVLDCANLLDQNFVCAVDSILHCSGRLVVSGVGKSGHVARKTAATFASTGTPAFLFTLVKRGMVTLEC